MAVETLLSSHVLTGVTRELLRADSLREFLIIGGVENVKCLGSFFLRGSLVGGELPVYSCQFTVLGCVFWLFIWLGG